MLRPMKLPSNLSVRFCCSRRDLLLQNTAEPPLASSLSWARIDYLAMYRQALFLCQIFAPETIRK